VFCLRHWPKGKSFLFVYAIGLLIVLVTVSQAFNVNVANAQHSSLSITLIISGPLGGQAPFSPAWGYSYGGAAEPVRLSIYWGDGTSNDLGSGCGNYCPSHTYNYPGTYTITIYITDSSGSSASDSKTITVYAAPPPSSHFSVSLTVTPLSGQAPFTPQMSYTIGAGAIAQSVVVYFGDGASLDVSPGKDWPAHTYNTPGTYTVTITATDANGNTASDAKTITVYGASRTYTYENPTSSTQPSTSSQGATLIPAITNVCNPARTIFIIIYAIIVTVVAIIILRRWIVSLFPGAALILAILVSIIVGAALILAIGDVCDHAITIITIIIIIVIIMLIFRRWIVGPAGGGGGVGGGALPPNVTGNATLTGVNGTRTQLTNTNLSQVGPGTTVETGNNSFVRVQTPKATTANSHSVIGLDSNLSWLDPNLQPSFPWLRIPGLSQIFNMERLLLQLNFGKLMLNWMKTGAAQEALIILPVGLVAAAATAAMSRWLARVKGTMVLVEGTKDGTAAAITVLEGDKGEQSSVELWRSDDLKVIEIHSGERVILKTGLPAAKTSVDLAKGLAQQVQDPFNLMHRWWTMPPATNDSLAALETPSADTKLSTGGEKQKFCTNCGEPIRPEKKFCMKCGTPANGS